jgi:DNA polymerase-1
VAEAETALAEEGSTRVYQMVDRPLVATVGRMERRGIKVDREYLAKLSGTFATEIARSSSGFTRPRQGPSPSARRSSLARCSTTGRPAGGRKGKSGQYSTDVNELERLAGEGVEAAGWCWTGAS